MTPSRSQLRASDADREGVVRALERHTAAGRLDLDEFADRVDQTLVARTLGDLARIVADLPPAERSAEASAESPDLPAEQEVSAPRPAAPGAGAHPANVGASTSNGCTRSGGQNPGGQDSGGRNSGGGNELVVAFLVAFVALVLIGVLVALFR